MAHEHDLNCLHDIGGKLVCKYEKAEPTVHRQTSSHIDKWSPKFMVPIQMGRYKLVPFHQLSPADQSRARSQYPHKSVGAMYDFIDEHYFYPVKKDGTLTTGRGVSRQLAIPHRFIVDAAFMRSLGYRMNPGWPR